MISAQQVALRACSLLLLLLYSGWKANVASGCVWNQWSPCSVTCGKGIRTRVGISSDCTQPSAKKCNATISCYASHLARLGVTVTQHPSEPAFKPARVTKYMIDGWTNSTSISKKLIDNQKCGQTGKDNNPWVRLDLKKAYLVSSVGVIIFSHTGENVVVRVGSSLINDGNDNPECGPVPYNKVNSMQIIWRNVSCSPSLWGKYINFQRTGTNVVLEICEAVFSYDASLDGSADIMITKDGSNVSGTIEISTKEERLVQSIDCTVSKSNLTAYLSWKHKNKMVASYTSAQQPGIYQVNGLQSQRLYIKNPTDSDSGVYFCELTIENTVLSSRSFTLRVGGYATHLANLNVTVTQHPKNTLPRLANRPKTLMIDGIPTTVSGQSLSPGSSCAATNKSKNPWVRLDLKKAYLVSVVRVINYGTSGQNVAVRVGSSLTNNGNDNHQCGIAPYIYSERTKAIWRNVSCSPSVWGRYINFDRIVTNGFLEICEVSFRYDAIVHIRIESKGTCTEVNGHSISVYQRDGLAHSIDCSIEPDSSNFTVPLTWKHNGNDVQTLSSQQSFGIYQVNESGIQRLYIINTTNSDAGTYSCEASVSDVDLVAKSFTLQFKYTWLWELSPCNGSCGVGSRHRNVATFEQHGGKKCTESMQKKCDTNRPPCVSSLDKYLSVDEGEVVNVSCQATQFAALSDPIRFEWFKVKDLEQSNVPVIIDGRVTNSTQNGGQGNFTGKLTFATVDRNDIGFYKCKAFNVHGRSNLSSSTSLNVTYGPESVAIHPTHPFVIKGADIVLNCSADGNPTPSYEWQLPQHQTHAGQTLQLSNIKFEEGGTYTCIATNSIGAGVKTSNISVTLQVEGPPQKCNKSSVSSYEGSTVSVNVSCENDGNSPITEYEIQYSTTPSGDWKSVKFNASSDGLFTLQGLMPFTYYDIRVRAANKYKYEKGDVSFSDPVSVQTAEGVPGPPNSVNVTKIGRHWGFVSWLPPTKPNGKIRCYLVDVQKLVTRQRRDTVEEMTLNVSSLDLHVNVTELSAFSNYSIQVAAVTIRSHDGKVLDGNESNVIYFRTKEDIPSKPLNLNAVSLAPSTIYLKWMEPETPNGVIQHYIVSYKNLNTTGNTTELEPVNGHNVSIYNLTNLEFYEVTVQAFTVGLGPQAKRVLQVLAIMSSSSSSSSSSGSVPVIVGVVVGILAIILIVIIVICVMRQRHSAKESLTKSGIMDFSYIVKSEEHGFNDYIATQSQSPVLSKECLSVTSYEGTTAVLPCDATGNPKPKIEWYFGNKQLPGKDSCFVVLGDGALQISKIKKSDGGVYKCVATNDAGTDEQKVELVVQPSGKNGNKATLWDDDSCATASLKQRRSTFGIHAVEIDQFPDFVAAMHENLNIGFSEEFKTLGSAGCDLPATACLANVNLNRYKNILTYDDSRVVLPVVEGMRDCTGDYIAAAYVDGYRKPKKYIASQGPQEHTVSDTWRMIWAENIPTIVMLTHLIEGNKIKCHRYWPNSEVIYNGMMVKQVETESFADHDIRQFEVTLNGERRCVKQYHFTAWPDHGVPKFATPLLGFIRRINREHPQDRGPMLIHCSAGVGRTGTFIVIDTMMEKIEDQQPIDIYNCIASLRTKRQDMVQTEAQYSFIHDAILEALMCGNTQIPVESLRVAVSKLSKRNGKSQKTGYDGHFEVLQTTGQQTEKYLYKAGNQPAAAKKNRYKDILPLDTQRVILRLNNDDADSAYVNTEAGADYINASYLDGYRHRDAFITTQGPLANTANDFWKMIWEQNSLTVVMLTSLQENDEEMSYKYWPSSGLSQYGPYTVELLKETNNGEYVLRMLKISKGSETRTLSHFQYTEWPDKGSPKATSQLLDMMGQVQKWQQGTTNTTITVHCNNGVGRTGVFCCLSCIIEQLKVEGVVDVFLKLRSMRIQRPGIVETVGQYKLMYDAVLAYLDGISTYSNFHY